MHVQRIQQCTLSLGLYRETSSYLIRTANRSSGIRIVSYNKFCMLCSFFLENIVPAMRILSCYRKKSAANTGNKTSQRQLRIYSGCSILRHKISIFLFYRPEKISNGSVGANSCFNQCMSHSANIFSEAVHTGLV